MIHRKACLALAASLLSIASLLPASEQILPAASIENPRKNIGVSARAQGLAGAFVSVAKGADSLFWNPAGLAFGRSGQLVLHHDQGFAGVMQESLGIQWPTQSGLGWGLALDWTNYGSFEDRAAQGTVIGSSTASDMGMRFGLALPLAKRFSLGAAWNLHRNDLGYSVAQSNRGEAGLLWRPWETIGIGLAAFNLGGGGSALYRAGMDALFRLPGGMGLRPAFSLSYAAAGELRLQSGLEWNIGGMFALRSGYQWAPNGLAPDGLSGLSAGLGLRYRLMILDYAFLPWGALGSSHRVSLGVGFGVQEVNTSVAAGFQSMGISIADAGRAISDAFTAPPSPLRKTIYFGLSGGYSVYTGFNPAAFEQILRNAPYTRSVVPPAQGWAGAGWVGWQTSLGLVSEVGLQIDPGREFSYTSDVSGIKIGFESKFSNFYISNLTGWHFAVGRVGMFTAGLKLGANLVQGTNKTNFDSTAPVVSVQATDQFFVVGAGGGPVLRFEFLSGPTGFGVETGYLHFPSLTGVETPDVGASSPGNVFDYSGFYVRLVLSAWVLGPFEQESPRPVDFWDIP